MQWFMSCWFWWEISPVAIDMCIWHLHSCKLVTLLMQEMKKDGVATVDYGLLLRDIEPSQTETLTPNAAGDWRRCCLSVIHLVGTKLSLLQDWHSLWKLCGSLGDFKDGQGKVGEKATFGEDWRKSCGICPVGGKTGTSQVHCVHAHCVCVLYNELACTHECVKYVLRQPMCLHQIWT